MNAQLTPVAPVTAVALLDPEQLDYLPAKTLLRLIERHQTTKKNFESFKATLAALPAMFRELEQMDIEPSFDLNSDSITLSFAGDGPRLASVWRVLRRYAYNTSDRPKKGDTMFSAFFRREGSATVYVYFTSTLCKRVQVGTKTVEQPVYETVCGDLPQIDEQGAPIVVATTEAFDDDIPF